MSNLYGADFFRNINPGSYESAKAVVPRVIELVRPKSVIDVGCGEGVWLSVFAEHGVAIHGLDGSYVTPQIPAENFTAVDLSTQWVAPGRCDLAVTLEVAEHLPEESADWFVNGLASMADTILFSAAIPGQGGNGHIHCKWQSYWIQKFADHGYRASSELRDEFWNDERVEVWYRQNMILFSKDGGIVSPEEKVPVDVVHPIMWGWYRGV